MEDLQPLEAFSFPYQIPSYDLRGSGFSEEDCLHVLQAEENFFNGIPLLESFPCDPFYASLAIEPSSSKIMQEDVMFCGVNDDVALWNEINDSGFMESVQQDSCVDYHDTGNGELPMEELESKRKTSRDERTSIVEKLSRKTISQYFYMPITQAAKELNIGLTLLKKRCRQLGINRWPHRKLMSLQALIQNMQKMEIEDEDKLRNAINILEREKKLLEEVPDLQLEDRTKRLRQACFKANYKKRRLMAMGTRIASTASMTGYETSKEIEDDADEIMKCLFNSSTHGHEY